MDGEMNMSSIASVSHGDGDTIPEDLDNFKEYMLKEQLKWSRYVVVDSGITCTGWVFWSQHDHEIEPSLSFDNRLDLNLNVCRIPKREYNIRHALEKLVSLYFIDVELSLVQFWAATKTLEGRTRLTTQYQPFALGHTWRTIETQQLCEYRMKMCSSEYNNCFYTDAESGEEQLGLPGRVFLHQFPESTVDVKYYSTKEYPQRDHAVSCNIHGSWAVPVFENSSRTCVGVLELASLSTLDDYDWRTRNSLRNMNDILEEFGLRCFIGNQACMRHVNAYQAREDEFWKRPEKVEGLTHACQELRTVLRSVCQIHKLPLAMTWVPCSACNGLRRVEVEFCSPRSRYRAMFLEVSKWSHLRKGLVFGRALSSPYMLYCSNISKLSLDDYPLVPYARLCKYSGWFIICLQNVYTGNDIYLLEFFLSARSKDDENILTTLSFILGTIEEKFKTFTLTSGKDLGELMSLEVIDFQNDQKIYFVKSIQATRNFSSVSHLSSSVQSSASVVNKRPRFKDANMVTIKGKYDRNSDPFSDSDPSSDSNLSFEQSAIRVANARPGFQDADMVTIKAKYASIAIVLKLSLPCRLVQLHQEVAKRLKLEAGTYHVVYKDEEDEFVLIACDEDLQAYVDASISQGNTSTVVLLQPKEPTTSLNPTN